MQPLPTKRTRSLFSLGWNSTANMDSIFLWATLVREFFEKHNSHTKGEEMKKDKAVAYECTWSLCKLVVPESDERIQEQKGNRVKTCPECGSPMQRRVYKEKKQ